jgi:hypothetical protein
MSIDLLIHIIIVLVVLGLIWWLIQVYLLPIVAEPFRTLIIVVVVLAVIFYLMTLLGGPSLHFGGGKITEALTTECAC